MRKRREPWNLWAHLHPCGSQRRDQVVRAIRPRRRGACASTRSPLKQTASLSRSGGRGSRRSWGNEAAIGQPTRVKRPRAHDLGLRARGGHGEAESGAVHPDMPFIVLRAPCCFRCGVSLSSPARVTTCSGGLLEGWRPQKSVFNPGTQIPSAAEASRPGAAVRMGSRRAPPAGWSPTTEWRVPGHTGAPRSCRRRQGAAGDPRNRARRWR